MRKHRKQDSTDYETIICFFKIGVLRSHIFPHQTMSAYTTDRSIENWCAYFTTQPRFCSILSNTNVIIRKKNFFLKYDKSADLKNRLLLAKDQDGK